MILYVQVEYKIDWVADLKDLITPFQAPRSARNVNEKHGINALEQLYSYMTFNNNRYSILTNWTQVWCFQHVEEGDHKILECAGPIELDGSLPSPSILKAFVGMVLLAEHNWFYTSPTPDTPPPDRGFPLTVTGLKSQKRAIKAAANYNVGPTHGTYPCLQLDFRLCDFQLSSARRSSTSLGSVVLTNLLRDALNKTPLVSMCKVVDISCNPPYRSVLENEVRAYAALQHLQGEVIPKVYGYYDVWRMLRVIALEPVGVAIQNEDVISKNLRKRMKKALSQIHGAGYLHGDIAHRNFCQRDGKVFMVDLESSRATDNESEKAEEMRLLHLL
jgi:hypothetical protein